MSSVFANKLRLNEVLLMIRVVSGLGLVMFLATACQVPNPSAEDGRPCERRFGEVRMKTLPVSGQAERVPDDAESAQKITSRNRNYLPSYLTE